MLHIDNDEIRTLYEPAREIDVFAYPAELVGQIDRYLSDEVARNAIASAGHARTVPAYSLHARAEQIVAGLSRRGIGPS
jgi:spore maturation protein CgeB